MRKLVLFLLWSLHFWMAVVDCEDLLLEIFRNVILHKYIPLQRSAISWGSKNVYDYAIQRKILFILVVEDGIEFSVLQFKIIWADYYYSTLSKLKGQITKSILISQLFLLLKFCQLMKRNPTFDTILSSIWYRLN